MAGSERQLPFEYWEMLKDGREQEFYLHAIGFVLTSDQYVTSLSRCVVDLVMFHVGGLLSLVANLSFN